MGENVTSDLLERPPPIPSCFHRKPESAGWRAQGGSVRLYLAAREFERLCMEPRTVPLVDSAAEDGGMNAPWEIYVGYAGECLRLADICPDEERKTLVGMAEAWLTEAEDAVEQKTEKDQPPFCRILV